MQYNQFPTEQRNGLEESASQAYVIQRNTPIENEN